MRKVLFSGNTWTEHQSVCGHRRSANLVQVTHCTYETMNTTGPTHRGGDRGQSAMQRQILWCSEFEQGKKKDVTNLVRRPGIQRGCRIDRKNPRFACECSTFSLVEARHGQFAWSTSLRPVPNTSSVSQTQEESVKSHEVPASVHSRIPAGEAGLAICRARGRASVNDRD